MNDELRTRVLDLARKSPAPTRARVQVHTTRTLVAGFALLGVIFFALGGLHVGRRPEGLVVATALGCATVAALATVVGFRRGRSMLGRPRAWLVLLSLLTPIGLLASALLARDVGWPEASSFLATRPADIRCFLTTTLLAAGPLVAFFVVRRGSDPIHPRAAASALAVIAGAWAALMIHLHCDVESTSHLGGAHVLPVVLAGVVGALVGKKVLGVPPV